jgi:hypothetical protein
MIRAPGSRAGGWLQTITAAGTVEHDTFTCQHCGRIVVVRHGCSPEELGGRCTCCGGLICPDCVGKGCDHIEKKLERAEAREKALRSYGLM